MIQRCNGDVVYNDVIMTSLSLTTRILMEWRVWRQVSLSNGSTITSASIIPTELEVIVMMSLPFYDDVIVVP